VRNFLQKHSSIYRWAQRPAAEAAEGWQQEAEALADASRNLSVEIQRVQWVNDRERDELAATHDSEIAQHDKANARLRRVNRFLVTKLREQGVAASEVPHERCPGCGSMAAIPENNKHPMGIVRYPDGPKRLFCDGSEE
jgi:hypothetical protein